MEEEPQDEWPVSVILKTEPEWLEGESNEHGHILKTEPEWLEGEPNEHADVSAEESDSVKIKEEPRWESTRLIVTDAFPPFVPSSARSSPISSQARYSSPTSMDYRKGKLFEIGNEFCDAGIESLLKECEEQLTPGKKAKKMYACHACNFEAPMRFALIRHKISAHGEQKYVCQLCDFKTGYLTDLARHEKNYHSSDKPYHCTQCKFRTDTLERLTAHGIVHSDDYLFCKLCSFKTKYENTLERHKLKHAVGKAHACMLCRYRSFTQRSLLKHINSKHSNVSP